MNSFTLLMTYRETIFGEFSRLGDAIALCRLDYIQMVVEKAFEEAGAPASGLSFAAFKDAMKGSKIHMQIDVPTD